jgi:hypothetical protein
MGWLASLGVGIAIDADADADTDSESSIDPAGAVGLKPQHHDNGSMSPAVVHHQVRVNSQRIGGNLYADSGLCRQPRQNPLI